MSKTARAVKLTALRLSTLTWLDRYFILRKLDSETSKRVKLAVKEINQLGIANKSELLEQLLNDEVEAKGENQGNELSSLPSELQNLLLNKQENLTVATHELLTVEVMKVIEKEIK